MHTVDDSNAVGSKRGADANEIPEGEEPPTAVSTATGHRSGSSLASASIGEALAKIAEAEGKAREILSKAELEAKETLRKAGIEAGSVYRETYDAHVSQAKASAPKTEEAREGARAEAERILRDTEAQLVALRKQADGRLGKVVSALAEELLSAAWGRAK